MINHFNRKNNIINKRKDSITDNKIECFIFEPMNKTSSEKNKSAQNERNIQNKSNILKSDKSECKNNKLDQINILDKLNNLIDKILNDEILIIALIALIIYERNKLKNNNAEKNELNDYDMMIAALIYLLL